MPHRRIELHPVKPESPIPRNIHHPRLRERQLSRHRRRQRRPQHPQRRHIRPPPPPPRRQQRPPEMAEIPPVKHQAILRPQQLLQRLMHIQRVHRIILRRQSLGPLRLRRPRRPQLIQPRQFRPSPPRRRLCHLLQYRRNIPGDAHRHPPVAPDFRRRRVNLDYPRPGRHRRRTAIPDAVILFPPQQNHQIRIPQQRRRPVQPPLEKPEHPRMLIRNQPPRLPLGHHRNPRSLNKILQHPPRQRITRPIAGDRQRTPRLRHQLHRLPHQLRRRRRPLRRPVLRWTIKRYLILIHHLLLHINRNSQMHRPPPPAERQPRRPGHKIGNPPRIVYHKRPFHHRRRQIHLIDFLHRPPPQIRQIGAPGDRQNRRIPMQRISQPRHRVSEPRRGIHTHP